MIDIAKTRSNIISECQSNIDYIKNTSMKITKYFSKESVHHFPNLEYLLELIYKQLPSQGKFLIISSADNLLFYPFFEKLKSYLRSLTDTLQERLYQMKNSKFHIHIYHHSYDVMLKKEKWFKKLRNKFISSLSLFTDDEIEEGIAELNATLDDVVQFELKYDFILLSKE
jgi:hypothetical protein